MVVGAKFKNVEQRTDDDVNDDLMADGRTIGEARAQAAEASRQRKAAEAKETASENADMRMRLAKVETKTDDDVNDDLMADGRTIGQARAQAALESKKRREDEATRLAERNAEMRKKRENVGQRTDDDIDDEAAGIARRELALASKQRKAAEAAELARRNEEMRARLHDVRAAIDDDVDDEAAGMARRAHVEASRARKEAEAKEIARKNAEMRNRLKNIKSKTDDGDGGGVFGNTALDQMLQLDPVVRPSTTHVATFARYQAGQDNRRKADDARHLRDGLLGLKRERAEAWVALGRERAKERQRREERTKLVQQAMVKKNQSVGRATRLEEERWEVVREARAAAHAEEGRVRVLEANALDARLDAAEDAADAIERRDGTTLRQKLAKAVARVRYKQLKHRKQMVAENMQHRAGPSEARAAWEDTSRQMAEEVRQKHTKLQSVKGEREDEYLKRARQNRERAIAIRAAARESMAGHLRERKAAAAKERANDILVVQAKARLLESNRREVAAVYAKRYVEPRQEAEWESSPLKRLASIVGAHHGKSSQASSRMSQVSV